MKDLSEKELERRRLIRAAVLDYFGTEKEEIVDRFTKVIIRKDFKSLDKYEDFHALHIVSNLLDDTYKGTLAQSS